MLCVAYSFFRVRDEFMGIWEKLKSSCCTCAENNALTAADDDFGAYERRNTDLNAPLLVLQVALIKGITQFMV